MVSFFQAVQALTGNPVLDFLMLTLAELSVFLVPFTLVLIWFKGEEGRKTSIYSFLSVVSALAISYLVLGQLIQHPSPFQKFDTLVSAEPENSFPSQHTATLLAMVLPMFWRKRRKIAYLFLGTGIITGFARIYIGQHYLIDVAGSGLAAVLGFIIVYALSFLLDEQIQFVADLGHRIEAELFNLVR